MNFESLVSENLVSFLIYLYYTFITCFIEKINKQTLYALIKTN